MESDGPKILFWEWVVKGKTTAPIVPISGSEFADFGLNCCIPAENPANSISGRSLMLSALLFTTRDC
jgi:hypothetical protein